MRKMSRGRVVARSALLDAVWRFPGRERVTIERGTDAEMARVDATWRSHRAPSTAHWQWQTIARQSQEHFLMRCDDCPAALWAGGRSDVGGPTYALDFLEVAPELRGSGLWGVFALDAICFRAHEAGARRIVFGALPGPAEWYRRYGAADGAPGWRFEPGLAPMTIGEQVLIEGTERLHGFREDEEAAT